MPVVWKILFFGIAAYVGLSGYVYFMQSGMIYLPNLPGRKLVSTPRQIGLAYEEVEFSTRDNEVLHGWFIPNESAHDTVLFFHGNAGNISHRLDSIRQFHQLGLNVFIFDYRGYGQSSGRTTEKGTYKDAEASWQYLTGKRGIKPDHIIIFGRSLGGAIAAWLASQHRASKVVIESSFSSIPSLANHLYPWLPVRWLSQFKYNTHQYVQNCHSPILIIHSPEDEIIPFTEGQKIFRSAHEPKQFMEIQGGHNDGYIVSEDRYLEGLKAFLIDPETGVE